MRALENCITGVASTEFLGMFCLIVAFIFRGNIFENTKISLMELAGKISDLNPMVLMFGS